MTRRGRIVLLGVALCVLLAGLACGCEAQSPRREKPRSPKLRPPVIGTTGVLRVAVDEHYPPFASVDGSRVVGLDVDVAAALASQLGLELRLVDVSAAEMPAALREKRADVGLGAIPITQAALSQMTVASSYLPDGPTLFSRAETVTTEHLDGLHIAVQADSTTFWLLRQKVGASAVTTAATLRDALSLAASGSVDAAAGDGIVAGYIARDMPALHFAGQLGNATPLAVTTARDGEALESAVRDAMDELAATGVLDALRAKWLGGLPVFRTASTGVTSSPDAP